MGSGGTRRAHVGDRTDLRRVDAADPQPGTHEEILETVVQMENPVHAGVSLLVSEVLRFFVVPHTHWDREWYRPFEHFRLWLGHAVDGVIETLERDPRFSSFTLDGQAVVLEDYVDVRPEQEPRLRGLLASGRLVVGPSYVLPDEFLVGAESLVRNLLIGREVCERFDATPSDVGYLPDGFGHILQLPQILRGFGIESFIFSRGLGDQLDDVGVVFRWCSPDRSEVLAFQQLDHYDNFAGVRDADDGEDRVQRIIERFGLALERAGVRDVLLCNGADHVPIQPELPLLCAELERRFPGSGFSIASYGEYVGAVGVVDVASWTGELLGSRLQNVLRGVNSSRVYLKQANERAERRLLAVETLVALGSLHHGEHALHPDLHLAWRDLLRCHPHDCICGCSCDEVHRDMLVRYESLERTLSELARCALEALAGERSLDRDRVTVFNPLPERRRGLVEASGFEPQIIELDGFTARAVQFKRAAQPRRLAATGIESDRLRLQLAEDGSLTLVDKRSGRLLERLHAFEDEPDRGDSYSFCPVDGASVWRSDQAVARVLADGPDVWELELAVEAELPEALDGARPMMVSIVTVARLVRGCGRVEFRTSVDNRACDHRLRVVFGVGDTADTDVRAESAFAVVRRPLHPPPPRAQWAEPPTPTQHTAGAVALGPVGLITKGVPEYEARVGPNGPELCLTLLRCVGLISKAADQLTTRPLSAGPQVPTPEAQCLGRYVFEYALLCDADAHDDLRLLRESQDYRVGFHLVPGGMAFDPLLRLEGDVMYSCLKGSEDGDGVILRCFNPSPQQVSMRVSGPVLASQTRLDETGEEPVEHAAVAVGPFEIATLRLRAGR
jgi:mannosylglycerate hydrolase